MRTKKETPPVTDAGNALIAAAGVQGANAGNGSTEGTNSAPGEAAQTVGGQPSAIIPAVPNTQVSDAAQPESVLLQTGDQAAQSQIARGAAINQNEDPRHGIVRQQEREKNEAIQPEVLPAVNQVAQAEPVLNNTSFNINQLKTGVNEAETTDLLLVKSVIDKELASRNITTGETLPNSEAPDTQDEKLKIYGEGYVEAANGEQTAIFTAEAWRQLHGHRGGWQQIVKTPPEVKALNL